MTIRAQIESLIKNEVLQSAHGEYFREPLAGFASADDPLFSQLKEIVGPHHIHPRDLLPEAKTVVSFFIPFSNNVVSSNRKSAEVAPEWGKSYVEANILINKISEKVIQMLTEKGIKGATIKATHTYGPKILKSDWSHRSAAFISGLGRFGRNRMLITPVGCAGRYGSVIISEEIAPDLRPEEEFCLNLKDGKCLFCINNCPTKALTLEGIDRHRCHDHLLEVRTGFSLRELPGCDVCGKCVVGPCAILG
jgi:epoxyqueuosine reductase QueG